MQRAHAIAALALLAAAPPARAEVLCVNSDAALVAAFATAAQSPAATEIRVRAGLYALVSPDANTPSLSYTGQSDLSVTGGWTGPNNACVSRLRDPDATILSAASTGPLMHVYAFTASAVTIELRGLSFRSGLTPSTQRAACLQIESDAGSGAEFIVEQNTFRNCTRTSSTGAPGGAIAMQLRSASARLRSNLVTGSFAGSGAVTLGGAGNATYYVSNNTIAANLAIPGRTGPFGMQLTSAGAGNLFWVQNNVLTGNGGTDLFVSQSVTPILTRNLIGSLGPLPAGSTSIDNDVDVDPRFVADGGFQPAADSPLRNRGANAAGGLAMTDVAGLPRWMGSSVDRGAYEFDEAFSDGFETP